MSIGHAQEHIIREYIIRNYECIPVAASVHLKQHNVGFSSDSYYVTVGHNPELAPCFFFKIRKFAGNDANEEYYRQKLLRMERVYKLIQFLYISGAPVAEIILNRNGTYSDLDTHSFVMMRALNVDKSRCVTVSEAANLLSLLHKKMQTLLDSDLSNMHSYQQNTPPFSETKRRLSSLDFHYKDIQEIYETSLCNCLKSQSTSLVLGDANITNFLPIVGNIVSFVDYDEIMLGNTRLDLGILFRSLALGSRLSGRLENKEKALEILHTIINVYNEGGVTPINAADIQLIIDFAIVDYVNKMAFHIGKKDAWVDPFIFIHNVTQFKKISIDTKEFADFTATKIQTSIQDLIQDRPNNEWKEKCRVSEEPLKK